jgi:ferredoxin--NADP+ reductase
MNEANRLQRVIGVRSLTDSTYAIKLAWDSAVKIQAGQRVALGLPDSDERRWYSVYSCCKGGEAEFLVREVENGNVSRQLRACQPGDQLVVGGVEGHFVIDPESIRTTTYLFIATGTGVAPFHAFVQAYPDLNYILLHGVRYLRERYDMQDYPPERYVACVSREEGGDFYGRVTDYLKQMDVPPTHKVYLCGNQRMIYDVYYALVSRDHPENAFATEVYF